MRKRVEECKARTALMYPETNMNGSLNHFRHMNQPMDQNHVWFFILIWMGLKCGDSLTLTNMFPRCIVSSH